MTQQNISVETADGTAPAGLFTPSGGESGSGIILFMDAFGPRPALDEMAEHMAGFGHWVLVPDLYYRHGEYNPFDAKTAFADEAEGKRLREMMGSTSQDMTARDSVGFVRALTDAGATGAIGTVGYCMGGARAFHAAASNADRVRGAMSFHGGNLASETEDSPHLRAAEIKARLYAGVAGVDRSFPPEQSARLAEALREAEVDHVIENYVGMGHGWTVPDNGVFDPTGADRHWARVESFFAETLS